MKRTKLPAFTLLEALVALLVISGGLLVFQGLTSLLRQELQYQSQIKLEEWLLFQDQLDIELSRSQFEGVRDNKLYLVQDQKPIAIGLAKGGDIRKTDATGGYQPMIDGVESLWIEKEESGVYSATL
ncbi:MAG: competence type IV pilus minor pilin ComGF [Streptococcus sp.]